ncbi:MAG: CpsD/CapB family tyrosine-protein kinase [Parvularculaceae bacterium]
MDRIREAVTKARQDRATSGAAGTSTISASGSRFHASPQRAAERFREVSCDFARFGAHRIISNEQDPVLNAYRILRTRVLQKMEENNWRTLAIVSPGAAAGKSVTAINLAIAIGSKQGSRATLVDLDFYRPRVSSYLGIKDPPSVLDFFEGAKALHDVTLKPDLTDVLVIANERVSRKGAEFLTSPRADELIARTVNEYSSRVVIFDLSPLLGCDDTIAFLPKVDCALLVAASGYTRVPELKEAQRLLAKTNVVGTLLNKAPRSSLVGGQYYY